jgi:hypothetical protein
VCVVLMNDRDPKEVNAWLKSLGVERFQLAIAPDEGCDAAVLLEKVLTSGA